MATSTRSGAANKGSGLVKGLKILFGLILVLVAGLVILRFAHRPTFETVASATGGWHDGMALYFWKDVSHALVDEAKLPEKEGKQAHATIDKLAGAIRTKKGDAEERKMLNEVADKFISQFESGKRGADDVRLVVTAANQALDAVHGGAKPKDGGKKDDAKPGDGEQKPAEEKPAEEKPAEEKPGEAKPVEEKPAEEKPAEEKPAGGDEPSGGDGSGG